MLRRGISIRFCDVYHWNVVDTFPNHCLLHSMYLDTYLAIYQYYLTHEEC